jgi:hypothetical protein
MTQTSSPFAAQVGHRLPAICLLSAAATWKNISVTELTGVVVILGTGSTGRVIRWTTAVDSMLDSFVEEDESNAIAAMKVRLLALIRPVTLM